MSNEAAHAELTAQITRLRTLPVRLRREAPPLVAKALDEQLRANIAAGRAPDGTPWAKTKKGEQALVNADKALAVTARGSVVFAKLTGPEALHNYGQVSGKVRRQILPSGRLPQSMTTAVRVVLVQLFQRVTKS